MDNLPLEAGDDAGVVKWVDISEKLELYASHSYFIKLVTEKRGAHWSEDPGSECHEWWKLGTDRLWEENMFSSPETDVLVILSESSVKFSWEKHWTVINRGFFRDFRLLLLISLLVWNEKNVELLLCFLGFIICCCFIMSADLHGSTGILTGGSSQALHFCTDSFPGIWIPQEWETCRITWIMT